MLQSLIQKYLCRKKGRFYVAFIDFTKAFDSIPHKLLWHKLIDTGVHGKLLNVLRNMYSKLNSCVQSATGLTDSFPCSIGTRQGCMISPMLFIIYIGELIEMLRSNGCKGIQVTGDIPAINSLLYADDIALCADSPGRLQNLLDMLSVFCKRWGLAINLNKSKIMVFRRGGILKRCEKWYFNGKNVEVVSQYKYLGVLFTTMLSWSSSQRNLAAQARKALAAIQNCQRKAGSVPYEIAKDIFHKAVVPVCTYGSEIWGNKLTLHRVNVYIQHFVRTGWVCLNRQQIWRYMAN